MGIFTKSVEAIKGPHRINKKNNPVRWRWRSCKNFFYNIYMRLRGYTPTQFQPFSNRYIYEKRKELDARLALMEKEPVHEVVGYMREPTPTPWYHSPESKRNIERDRGRRAALEALRTGDIKNARLVRRPLSGE